MNSRRRKLKKWTTERQETSPDPGRGVSHRISNNKEPQFDNNRKYCERPVRKKDTMMHENYNTLVPRNTDSDESDSDIMLPIGAF